jgi:SAM-dependent methyltransferase
VHPPHVKLYYRYSIRAVQIRLHRMKSELLQQCNLCDSTRVDVFDRDCNIAKCWACGYIFDDPRPAEEELIEFYSRPGKYDSWLNELEARERIWKRRLSKLQSTKKPGSLLDVGTGIGQFLALARGSYAHVYGTEVSTTAVKISREKYNLDIFQGTIDDLAVQGKVFDNISLFHVLEHVTDPRSVLKACRSLLSDGGILVIAVPNEIASLRGVKRRMFGVGNHHGSGKLGLPRITLDGAIDEIHLSHFTPPVLRRLVEATGFSVLKNTVDPYYIRTGVRRWKADLYYYFCLMFLQLFRVNIYDAILVVARKVSVPPSQPRAGC